LNRFHPQPLQIHLHPHRRSHVTRPPPEPANIRSTPRPTSESRFARNAYAQTTSHTPMQNGRRRAKLEPQLPAKPLNYDAGATPVNAM
jgi:hypothetical protein